MFNNQLQSEQQQKQLSYSRVTVDTMWQFMSYVCVIPQMETYTVTVATGTSEYAGTNNYIYVTLVGEDAESDRTLLDNPGLDFCRGAVSVDFVEMCGCDVSSWTSTNNPFHKWRKTVSSLCFRIEVVQIIKQALNKGLYITLDDVAYWQTWSMLQYKRIKINCTLSSLNIFINYNKNTHITSIF